MCRFDADRGNKDSASKWAWCISKSLLTVGRSLLSLGIAQPLADYYEQQIYPVAESSNGYIYTNAGVKITEMIFLLERCQTFLKDAGILTPRAIKTPIAKALFLSGRHGRDIRVAVMPLRVPKGTKLSTTEPLHMQFTQRACHLKAIDKLWGLYRLRNLDAFKSKMFIPWQIDSDDPKWGFLYTMKINDFACDYMMSSIRTDSELSPSLTNGLVSSVSWHP
jgi:hypothetical protein